MTELVIHIGDPKTGTTSIQKALHRQIVDSGAQRILPWRRPNAVSVAKSLHSSALPAETTRHFRRVREWLVGRDEDIAVLSSEFFSPIQPSRLQNALHEHLPEYADTARILAYVRPHVSRFLAAFIQRIKTGQRDGDMDGFLAAMIRGESPHHRVLHCSARFRCWQQVFNERFTLRPFIRSELREADVVHDFYTQLLGESSFSIRETIVENTAVTKRALSGLRLVHRRFRRAGTSPLDRQSLGTALSNHYIPTGHMLEGDKPRLDRRTIEALIEAFRGDARALDSAFFVRPVMQDALESSIEMAAEEPMDLDSDRYFTAAEQKALWDLAGESVSLYLSCPQISRLHFHVLRGLVRPDVAQKSKLVWRHRHLERLDLAMTQIGDILRG